jgi:hypothetical protein
MLCSFIYFCIHIKSTRFCARSYYNVDDGILYLVMELMDDSFAAVLDVRGFLPEVSRSLLR